MYTQCDEPQNTKDKEILQATREKRRKAHSGKQFNNILLSFLARIDSRTQWRKLQFAKKTVNSEFYFELNFFSKMRKRERDFRLYNE